METEGSFVSGFGDVIQGSAYGFTGTVASSRHGFLFSGSMSDENRHWVRSKLNWISLIEKN